MTQSGLISILCPTRNRPENVVRLVNSILETVSNRDLVEILFYVDQDDQTFTEHIRHLANIQVFQGPNIWISNAHNFLYVMSKGEIIFSAGDDMIFQTRNWDILVRDKFHEINDGIGLVFGNDLGTHAGKIATHGFFHRNWIDVLGTWVQPGRGSLWDMWSTENARILNRLYFLKDLVIEHRHYRQSTKGAEFDSTYARIRTSNSSFRPEITYRKLARERRIDRILLAEKMSEIPPRESSYLLAGLLAKKKGIRDNREFFLRISTLDNYAMLLQFPLISFRFLLKILARR